MERNTKRIPLSENSERGILVIVWIGKLRFLFAGLLFVLLVEVELHFVHQLDEHSVLAQSFDYE